MVDKKIQDKIKSLIKILKKENLSSIKVSTKSETIEVVNSYTPSPTQVSLPNIIKPSEKDSSTVISNSIKNETIVSPMVGIIYLSPKPGSPSFVKKGQRIKKGATICLIEAMKTFNEIKADKDGMILNILIKNGQPVEFDQPLIELK